jgi:glutamate racemase
MPHEHFVYVADSGHAPYGERDDAHVIARSHAIAQHLKIHCDIKALVVACNTATAAAIAELRQAYPEFPIIGIEPALKPAVAQTRTGSIGVMATRGTLNSEKFRLLLASLQGRANFILQPCEGLADAIEHANATKIIAACAMYTGSMGSFGQNSGEIDTLVLGCTHYPFAHVQLAALVGPTVAMLEGGEPVARQTHRLLLAAGQLEPPSTVSNNGDEKLRFYSTGDTTLLRDALARWLGTNAEVMAVRIE